MQKYPDCDLENPEEARHPAKRRGSLKSQVNTSAFLAAPSVRAALPLPAEVAVLPILLAAWPVLPKHLAQLLLPGRTVFSPGTPEPPVTPAAPVLTAPEEVPSRPETPVVPAPTEAPARAAAPSAPSPKAAAKPSIFGQRYKVIETLGSGRLGTVYKAYDQVLKRDLAIRSIKAESPPDPGLCESATGAFKKERRIIHKNVGWIIDLGAERGTLYLTMGYSPGQELHRLIKEKGRLPIGKALNLGIQAINGLIAAHRLGSVHLDLRPGNIMVDQNGKVRVMDLGVVSFLRAKGIIGPDFVEGNPEYLSPEQIKGYEGDARSDIYSFGLIIYEMVTGRPAFRAETASEIKRKQVTESPRSPRLLNPLVSEPLSLLILRCLEKNPEKRYQSAGDVLSDLEQVESGVENEPAEEPAPGISKKKSVAKQSEAAGVLRQKFRNVRQADLGKFVPQKRILGAALCIMAGILMSIVFWRFVLHPSRISAQLPQMASRPSVAVLPFRDLSAAKTHEHWGDGMTEMLIDGLSKISDIFVPGCDSSFLFRGNITAFKEIGRELGADLLLSANYKKDGDSLRIDARLIRAKDESVVWSMQWDRKPAELTNVLEDIGQKVLNSLGAGLPQSAKVTLLPDNPVNLEAFDLYAQGLYLSRKGDQVSLEQAKEAFEKASAKEPRCALILAGLAESFITLGNTGLWPSEKAFSSAKIQALNALRISPDLAAAQTVLGLIKWKYEWDFAEAERRFQEALRINPNSAEALSSYAELLSNLGRHEEAVAKIKLAMAQDPLSPKIGAQVGSILYYARLYDQAIEETKNQLQNNPRNYRYHYDLGMVCIQLGEYDEAVQSFRRAADLGGDALELDLDIAYVNAIQKRRAEAGRALSEAMRNSNQAHVSLVSLAAVYGALLETDQAIACLKKAFNERDPRLLLLKVHPMLDFVRRDPSFIELVRKIGL